MVETGAREARHTSSDAISQRNIAERDQEAGLKTGNVHITGKGEITQVKTATAPVTKIFLRSQNKGKRVESAIKSDIDESRHAKTRKGLTLLTMMEKILRFWKLDRSRHQK